MMTYLFSFLMVLELDSTMTLRSRMQKLTPPHVGFTSQPTHQAAGQKTTLNGKKASMLLVRHSETGREEVALGGVTHKNTLNMQ